MEQKGLELLWCIINLSLLPETSSFSVALDSVARLDR